MQATYTLTTTGFAAPIGAADTLVTLTSLTGIVVGATNTHLFANHELLAVQSLTGVGNQVIVKRGVDGTAARAHGTGETIYVAEAWQLFEMDPEGLAPLATRSNPHINIRNGKVWVIQGDDEGPGTQTRRWAEVTTTQSIGALGVRVDTVTTPS